jgi:uncharacterized protein (DUF111 family)
VVNAMPEYEDVRRISAQSGKPLKEVQEAAMRAYAELSQKE